MQLLVDSISTPFAFVFFDANGYFSVHRADIRGREFDMFLEELEAAAQKENIKLRDIQSITSVSWPAQFTSIRIVSLTLNTLARSYHIPLFSLDFFELAEFCGAQYPMLVNANRGEVVLRRDKHSPAGITQKLELTDGEYFGAALPSDFENPEIRIQSAVWYEKIISRLPRQAHPVDALEPYYLKKPNIT